jgi:hypothetical protein
LTDIDTQQIRRKPIVNGLINEYTHAASGTEDLQATSRILFRAGQAAAAFAVEQEAGKPPQHRLRLVVTLRDDAEPSG